MNVTQLGDTITFTNQNQLTPQNLVGSWQLEGESNEVQFGATMPLSLLLNSDGSGVWYEGISERNLRWLKSDEYLILYDNSSIYYFVATLHDNTTLELRANYNSGSFSKEFTYSKG